MRKSGGIAVMSVRGRALSYRFLAPAAKFREIRSPSDYPLFNFVRFLRKSVIPT